jgi:hypothetical protein
MGGLPQRRRWSAACSSRSPPVWQHGGLVSSEVRALCCSGSGPHRLTAVARKGWRSPALLPLDAEAERRWEAYENGGTPVAARPA